MSCQTLFLKVIKTYAAFNCINTKTKTDKLLYWKALALHSRAALIHADHIVSAQQYSLQNLKMYRYLQIQSLKL